MQFLESSAIGLRSAFYELKSNDHNLEIVLFPMVHIGLPSFYSQIQDELEDCDYLIYEGVASARSWFIVQSYKLVTRRADLGLVLQNEALNTSSLSLSRIHGDISTEAFDASWKQLPIHLRACILCLAPLYGAWRYLTATHESLARGHSVNDYPEFDELSDDMEQLRELILDERDRRLVEVLRQHVAKNGHTTHKTALVWGASHMPAAFSCLSGEFGFRVSKGEWVQAI